MSDNSRHPHEATGIAYGTLAYIIWGVMPLYWRALDAVPPLQVATHRVLWSGLFVALVTAARGRLGHVATVFTNRSLIGTLVLTSILISTNWLLFLYSVATDQLVEASLGYYLTPLLSIVLGVFLFGESLSRVKLMGVGLAAIALVVQIAGFGRVPWLGLALASTFGFYGFFRKKAPVDSIDGLFVETALLFPLALGLILYWARTAPHAFPASGSWVDALLVGAGPLTAIPLALFAAATRRMRLTIMGFLQYLSPTITLVLATFAFHEHFGRVETISFGLVWAALMLVAFEGRLKRLVTAPERSG